VQAGTSLAKTHRGIGHSRQQRVRPVSHAWERDELTRAVEPLSERGLDGTAWVDTDSFLRWSTPCGGFKANGRGCENGIDALDHPDDGKK